MTNPIKILAAPLLSLTLLAGCETTSTAPSGLPVRISEPIYQAIYNLGVARIFGEECSNIRFSRIASDRYIEDVVEGVIRRGNNPLEVRRALREVSESRLNADFDKFLADNNASDRASFCAVGSAEIANRTIIGEMMAGG